MRFGDKICPKMEVSKLLLKQSQMSSVGSCLPSSLNQLVFLEIIRLMTEEIHTTPMLIFASSTQHQGVFKQKCEIFCILFVADVVCHTNDLEEQSGNKPLLYFDFSAELCSPLCSALFLFFFFSRAPYKEKISL